MVICEPNKFNKVVFKNFTITGNISEISFKNKTTGEDILYTLSGNFEGIPSKINDGNFSKDSISITNDTILTLDFNQLYDIYNLDIYIYITDDGLNKTFKMSFLQEKYPISEKVLTINTLPYSVTAGKYRMIITPDSSWNNQTEFIEKYYRYKDKLFKYYDIERRYIDGYFIALDGYIKDEKQSKTFYRYKKNEILKNKENIITEKLQKNNEKENDIEKVEVYKPKIEEDDNDTSSIKIIVASSLILSLILVISKILYKKNIISRTI